MDPEDIHRPRLLEIEARSNTNGIAEPSGRAGLVVRLTEELGPKGPLSEVGRRRKTQAVPIAHRSSLVPHEEISIVEQKSAYLHRQRQLTAKLIFRSRTLGRKQCGSHCNLQMFVGAAPQVEHEERGVGIAEDSSRNRIHRGLR